MFLALFRKKPGIFFKKLAADKEPLEAANKAVLVSATNHMDRLRGLYGKIGSNYQKLASTAATA